MDYKTLMERVDSVINSRPEEVPEEEKVNENYLRLVLGNVSNFLTRKEEEERQTQKELETTESALRAMDHFLDQLGFSRVASGISGKYRHKGLRMCYCGHFPEVFEQIEEPGKWRVRCPECFLITEIHDSPINAMKAWQQKRYLKAAEMVSHRLTLEELDDEGAIALVEKAIAVAKEDYIEGNNSTKASVEKFVRSSNFMMGVEPDAVIEEWNREAKHRAEEKKREPEKEGA